MLAAINDVMKTLDDRWHFAQANVASFRLLVEWFEKQVRVGGGWQVGEPFNVVLVLHFELLASTIHHLFLFFPSVCHIHSEHECSQLKIKDYYA